MRAQEEEDSWHLSGKLLIALAKNVDFVENQNILPSIYHRKRGKK